MEIEDLEEAIEKMMAGPQRRSRVMSDKIKKVVAYHEGGHALIARLIPGCDPVHKITIISRGDALGYTLQMPEEDKYLVSKDDLLNTLCVMLGGRAAEETVFGEITTGAQNDISRVSAYAHKMVLEYGMSEKVGPLALQKGQSEVFLGRDIVNQPGYSESTAQIVDEEIKKIVHSCYERAKNLLNENRAVLDKLAERLVAVETVSGEELDWLIQGLDPDAELAKKKAEAEAKRKAEREARRKAAEEAKKAKAAAAADSAAGTTTTAEKDKDSEPADKVSGIDKEEKKIVEKENSVKNGDEKKE